MGQKDKTMQVQEAYSRARRDKDRRYDGRFFFGVTTTGIFCRPSCPSPTANEENVEYFDTVFGALESGFRPCRRCRPDVEVDYSNGNAAGTSVVNRALQMIYDGYLNDRSLADLSGDLSISQRHLRKLFVDTLGVPPVKIARYHKALFAKKLLLSSQRTIAHTAYASGFGSIRQLNDTFKDIFGITPSEARTEATGPAVSSNTTLLLRYERPLDFDQMLSFLAPRAIKGVEDVRGGCYSRTFRTSKTSGYLTVRDNPEASALELSVLCDDITGYMEIHNRVRRMFDLDADIDAIRKQIGKDSVPRLPTAFHPFECMVRAIAGQQVTVKAATTVAGRIAERACIRADQPFPPGLSFFFPSAEELVSTDLSGLGMTGARQETLLRATQGVLDNTLSLSPSQSFETFRDAFVSIKGIGDWTAHYVGMRGLGMVDCFPANDLGVIKAMTQGKSKPTTKEILDRAEPWRPFRAYAALCLWRSLED